MILQEDPSVDLETPTGPMRTYVYRPVAPGRYPGLVFFSEIFQRTGPIKRTAALLAGLAALRNIPLAKGPGNDKSRGFPRMDGKAHRLPHGLRR